MPLSDENTRRNPCFWDWEDAFYKFGFEDGDGLIETPQVEQVLVKAGYEVVTYGWGLHNTVIESIKRGGKEFVPRDNPAVEFGYDDPRSYLPEDIVELLDNTFAETA